MRTRILCALAAALMTGGCNASMSGADMRAVASEPALLSTPRVPLGETPAPARDTSLLTVSTRGLADPTARSATPSFARKTFLGGEPRTEYFDASGFLALVRERLNPGLFTTGGQALIFVHGFNNTESDAVGRAHSLSEKLAYDGLPLAFVWPSVGGGLRGIRKYPYDLQSSIFSRDELAALLEKLVDQGGVGRVQIVGHSMGCWLVMETLRQTAIAKQSDVLAKISSVVLVAPDIDVDVFETQLKSVGPFAQRIAVFSGTDDYVLGLSQEFSSDLRLGRLSLDELADRFSGTGVAFYDTTKIRGGTKHYKAETPAVLEEISRLVGGGSPATASR